jgi:anti-sigma-K factor RskA
MTSDTNSERIDELIALAALGELSTEARRELDEAALADPTVAVELDQALEAAAALQRPHAEEPPPALRSSVLAAIASTPQDAAAERGVASLDVERDRRRRRLGPLLAAAAAVLLMIGGVVVVMSGDDGDADPIAAVVEAADATTRGLSGDIDSLSVTFSRSEQALVVEGDGVPVPDQSATYQLWLVSDEGATSVGTFRPDDDGSVEVRFDGVDPTDFVLGVTREPAGGSESPTLPILASA